MTRAWPILLRIYANADDDSQDRAEVFHSMDCANSWLANQGLPKFHAGSWHPNKRRIYPPIVFVVTENPAVIAIRAAACPVIEVADIQCRQCGKPLRQYSRGAWQDIPKEPATPRAR